MKDLDDILSGSEPAPVETKEIETQPVETHAESQNEATPQADETHDGKVPVAALQAERQKAKTYREQVAEFDRRLAEQNQLWEQRMAQVLAAVTPQPQQQPQPQAPEFWEAPEQAIDYRLNQTVAPLQEQLAKMREDFSRMQATDKHGNEAVDQAYNALAQMKMSGDPAFWPEYQRIMSSPHPYASLVEWHRKQQAVAEIGNDPQAYKEKLKAELLAELQASPPPSPQGATAVMPSNFATARNVGQRSGPAWSGPQSLGDIFKR